MCIRDSAYRDFQTDLQKRYGKDYFRWNIGYTIFGIILSVIAIGTAFSQFYGNNSDYFFIILGTLVAINLLFIFLMPAPTQKGQKIKSEIEGFKLYLEMAEKKQLNARKDVLSGQEPVSYTHLRAHETVLDLVCRLLLEKKKNK